MQRIAQRVLKEIPGTAMAQDSSGRETDIAFDHNEFHHLSPNKFSKWSPSKTRRHDRHSQQHPHQRLVW
jgi:hypothetical protein